MVEGTAIIGGGPAGFMAGIIAAENGAENIEIFESKEALKSILWTGNGRCNITNATFDFKELAASYPRGEKFLYSAFSKFGSVECMDWFSSHGLELYIESDNRVFPKSNDASEVRSVLLNLAKNSGIKVNNHTQVLDIEAFGDKFRVITAKNHLLFDKLVISTGGNYKKPVNSGYFMAEKLGHSVTKLKPSLSALVVKEIWAYGLAGVGVKRAEIKALQGSKEIAHAYGDFIFTHRGVSGPLIFKISSYCAFVDYDEENPLILKINFVPDIEKSALEKEILNELDKNSKKSVENILKKYIPRSLIQALLGSELIDPEKKASQITREDRKSIIRLLTEAILSAKASESDHEIVTAGGVELNEVNAATMESKLHKNLYFCGELLNIDGLTGGFNLQACWSTGYAAGISLAK